MSSFLSQIGSALTHATSIPEAAMPDAVETLQELLVGKPTPSWEEVIRAVEKVQALYLSHKIVQQSTPRGLPSILPPLVESEVDSGIADTGSRMPVHEANVPKR